MDINWTFIISTCITSAFSSATTMLTVRYLSKMVDKIEGKKEDKSNPEPIEGKKEDKSNPEP